MKKKNTKWKKYGSTEHEDGNVILGALEGLWGQTRSMDSGIRVTTCKTGDRRLLDKVFELKSIKRGGKILFRQLKKSLKI